MKNQGKIEGVLVEIFYVQSAQKPLENKVNFIENFNKFF